MIRGWPLLAALLFAAAPLHPALAETQTKQPYELVRSLRAIQDQIARGNMAAHHFQKKFIPQVTDLLNQAKPEVWKEPKNARAAVIFVLSGGNPSVLQKILESKEEPSIDAALIKGALAYSEGRLGEADKLLGKFDARQVDPSLAGLIALVQAMLTEKKGTFAPANRLYDDARLLAPGTLVEESALRRQTFMAAAEKNLPRFETLSSQYFRRFGRCVYGIIFRRQFTKTMAAHQYTDDLNLMKRMESVINDLWPAGRLEVYAIATAEGVRRGKIEFARYMGAKAAALAPANSTASWRVKLYNGATAIVTPDYDQGLAELQSIPRDRLSKKDTAFLDAALGLAHGLHRLPDPPAPGTGPPPDASGTAPAGNEAIERAKLTIAAADGLLKAPAASAGR
jgi:chemotaxis protein MotC